MKTKVSFDFDGTLRRKDVQEFAKELTDRGIEVWIVTTRTNDQDILDRNWHWCKDQNVILFKIAEECGISKNNIVFTDHVDKVHFLEGKSFLFHLDDDTDELMEILKSKDSCVPLHVDHLNWKENCLELLNK